MEKFARDLAAGPSRGKQGRNLREVGCVVGLTPSGVSLRRPDRRIAAILAAAAAAAFVLLVVAAPAHAERTYESNIEGFSSAYGIAVDGQDNVWVADASGSGLISKYDAFPSQTKEAEQGGEGHFDSNLRSLAFDDPLDRLYVADSGPVVVDLFEHGNGPFIEKWSTENSCGLDYVAVDNSGGATQGRVYVARSCGGPQHIQAFKSNHEPADFSGSAGYISENHITGTPFGEIGEISGIATDSAGNFYIADRSNGVIDEFAPSGIFVQEFNGNAVPGGFGSISGVAVDPTNGNVLVVDQGKDVVDEFESSGAFVEQLTGTGPSEATPFSSLPGGIVVNSSGYVYVADGPAVDIFGPNAILPKVAYEPATDQTQTSGILNASINLNGGPEVTSCTFQYGTTTAYGSSVPCSPAAPYTTNKSVSAEISGLTTEDTYHYRVVLVTANGTKKANDQTFIPHAVAGLTTESATDVERNTATLNGSFNGNGEDTHYFFEWGTTEAYGSKTPVQDEGSPTEPKSLSASLSGLTVETTYHYRVVASNAVGTSYGSDQSFKTLAAVEELSTEPASNITASSATLNGSYNGISEDVHYYFEWGTNTEYGNITTGPPGLDSGAQSGHQGLSFNLSGLGVDQTYHYRVIASDASGTTKGADQTFTTLGRYQFSTSFGSTGSGDGQMSHPEDVAVDNSNGDVYVADIGNHRIDKFDSSGQFLAAWGWGVANGATESQVCTSGCQIGLSGTEAGQFEKPNFVEVDNSGDASAGDVYVGDTGDGFVQKFDSSGHLVGSWGTNGVMDFSKGGTIGGITVDNNGNLFVVTDNTPYNWTEISSDGVSQTKWPTNGTWEDGDRLELGSPAGTGIDISGSEIWYENTEYGLRYSSPTASEYSAFTIGPTGTGLALNRAANDVYDDSGTFIQQFPAKECDAINHCEPADTFGAGVLKGAAGLAFKPAGELLYAANSAADDIAVFAPLPAPKVVTGPPASAGPTSATMTGTVDPGAGQISACYFEYLEGPITNEIQILKPEGVTGGTYTLSFEGETTNAITYENSPFSYSSVEYALSELPSIGSGNVRVSLLGNGSYLIEFIGRFTQVNVPEIEVNAAGVTPPGSTMTTSTVAQGNGWDSPPSVTTVPCAQSTPISAPTEVSANLIGLTPFTTYHYRVVAIRSDGKGFPAVGREQNFVAAPTQRPAVDSTSFSAVSPTTVTLKGKINPDGSPTIYRFEYGQSMGYGSQTLPSESIGEDSTDHEVSSEITNLEPGATYHFRLVAININGPSEGIDVTFNTPSQPTVTGGTISNLTADSATLNAQVKPGFRATSYHFEYGRASAYGSSTPESGAIGTDNSIHPASASISGLAPNTTYHFRVVATNEIGSADGSDGTFTTPTAPKPEEPHKTEPPNCKKGFVKRHGKCVKKHSKHHKRHHKRGSGNG